MEVSQKKHYHWLDLLRFLAALAVVFVHARGEVWETYSLLEPSSQNTFTYILYAILSQGFTGVIVFFVLSGFLVGGRTCEKIYNKTADAKQYAVDRIVRIGLPLLGSILLIIIVDFVLGKSSDFVMLAGNVFALQGIFVSDAGGVFWTLSYEMWFYCLIFALILLCNNKKALLGGGGITLVFRCVYGSSNALFVNPHLWHIFLLFSKKETTEIKCCHDCIFNRLFHLGCRKDVISNIKFI